MGSLTQNAAGPERPSDPSVERGRALLAEGKPEQAAAVFEAGLAAAPEDPRALAGLANTRTFSASTVTFFWNIRCRSCNQAVRSNVAVRGPERFTPLKSGA